MCREEVQLCYVTFGIHPVWKCSWCSELYGLREDALSQVLCPNPAGTNTLLQKHDDDDDGAGDFRFCLYLSCLV